MSVLSIYSLREVYKLDIDQLVCVKKQMNKLKRKYIFFVP